MDAANYVVEKILGNAQEAADSLVSEAKQRAAEKQRLARKEAETEEEAELVKAQNKIKDMKGRSSQLAVVERKKAELAAKHGIIDKVFEEAREQILEAKTYKELIKNLILKYCNCDACIVISEKDKKVLTAEFIKTCSTKIKHKLTREVDSSFEGGIIIRSDKYDIDLTLAELLDSAREKIEVKVAGLLWG